MHNKYILIFKKVWWSHVSAMLMNPGSRNGHFQCTFSQYLRENEGMHSEQNSISVTQSVNLLHVPTPQIIITKNKINILLYKISKCDI